jgi:hypothetical protein
LGDNYTLKKGAVYYFSRKKLYLDIKDTKVDSSDRAVPIRKFGMIWEKITFK